MERNKILKTRHVLTLVHKMTTIANELGLPPEAEQAFITAFFREWIDIADVEIAERKDDDETSRAHTYQIPK